MSNDRIWRPRANPTNRVARRWPHEPQNRSVDQIRAARDRSLALSDERAAKDTAHLGRRFEHHTTRPVKSAVDARTVTPQQPTQGRHRVDPRSANGRCAPYSAAPSQGRSSPENIVSPRLGSVNCGPTGNQAAAERNHRQTVGHATNPFAAGRSGMLARSPELTPRGAALLSWVACPGVGGAARDAA